VKNNSFVCYARAATLCPVGPGILFTLKIWPLFQSKAAIVRKQGLSSVHVQALGFRKSAPIAAAKLPL
jgi:hypothetical protein